MAFTRRERAMLIVALENLIVDYIKAGRRAKRQRSLVIEKACDEAVARYRRLATKVMHDAE